MKKRVRKTQRLTLWDRVKGQFKEVVVKHDVTRAVRMDGVTRGANYVNQNGGEWLTPRQAKRMRLKGQVSSIQTRGYRSPAGQVEYVTDPTP